MEDLRDPSKAKQKVFVDVSYTQTFPGVCRLGRKSWLDREGFGLHLEGELHKCTHPVAQGSLWSGCKGRICRKEPLFPPAVPPSPSLKVRDQPDSNVCT